MKKLLILILLLVCLKTEAAVYSSYPITNALQLTDSILLLANGNLYRATISTVRGPATSSGPWTNDNGNIYPNPFGDIVFIESQLADNATNVALVVDTSVPWTSGFLQTWNNDGTNRLEVLFNGGLFSGNQSPVNVLGFEVKNNPDLDFLGGNQGAFKMDFYDNAGVEAVATLSATLNGGPASSVQFEASPDGYTTFLGSYNSVNATQIHITGYNQLGTLFDLNPTVASSGSATAYMLGTSTNLFSGDKILALQNHGTNRATIEFDGAITAGSTNRLKTGPIVTGASVALTTTNYLELTVNGVVKKVALVQ